MGLARAVGGAIIFGLPLLMTMEMWFLGFYIQSGRLLLFLAANLLILVGLSRFGGFERTVSMAEDVLDALAAFAVGILASAAILALFGIIGASTPLEELVGKIAIQSVPASFGAMLARKQLSSGAKEDSQDEEQALRSAGYLGQLFLMIAGALFLAFNVAPTEEMILISFIMSPFHLLGLIAASLLLLHLFVYQVGFAGQEEAPQGSGVRRTFLAYTIPGYAIAIMVSLYVLWTFGRTDGMDVAEIAAAMIVLGFPASVGAAIARLVV